MTSEEHERLVGQVARHEGVRLGPYDDGHGNITIGIGRNLTGNGISRAEAYMMLDNDIHEAELDLRKIFIRWDEYEEARRHALIDMRINLGPGRFRGFKNMITAVKASMWSEAADEAKHRSPRTSPALTDWYKQVKALRGDYICYCLRFGERPR